MIISGWWYTYPSEKYELVSWDYDIPNIWKNNPKVPNHQPVYIYVNNIYIYTYIYICICEFPSMGVPRWMVYWLENPNPYSSPDSQIFQCPAFVTPLPK